MGFKLVASLTLLAVVAHQVAAADGYYDIPVRRHLKAAADDPLTKTLPRIENVSVAPDGFTRDAIQAGTLPGQLIIAQKADVVHLNVTNKLETPSMRRRPNCSGGVLTVQSPAARTDRDLLPLPQVPQYIDGERGVLVIYGMPLQATVANTLLMMYANPDDPQKALWDVDGISTIITLADWYHKPAEELMAQFKIDDNEPVPDSGLINGVGRYIGGPAVPWAVVNVVAGKSLRVINISGFAAFTFSIQDHTLDVIEADDIATQTDLDNDNVKAILRYAGAPIQDPPTAKVVVLTDPVLIAAKKKLELEESNLATWDINGISYVPPTLPTLLNIINGATVASDFTIAENTFILFPNEVVELRIHGSNHGITHPFHFHGHTFDVVKGSSGKANYVNPIRRDVEINNILRSGSTSAPLTTLSLKGVCSSAWRAVARHRKLCYIFVLGFRVWFSSFTSGIQSVFTQLEVE
ncbi:Cupredoxin [Mycena vulgaris]|nr:Cupredoxin [Mycena vulgaris]